MHVRDSDIDALARHLIEGLIAAGSIKPKAATDALIACVVEFLSENFETEARIDEEADRLAETQARQHPGIDVTRMRSLIKQKLAEKENFTI
jgi:hypothetical protein